MVEILLGGLERKLGETSREEIKSVEGENLFTIGEDISVYAEVTSAAVEGLRRLATGGALGADLRARIVGALLKKWGEIAAMDVVWGPASIASLARALGAIAGDAATAAPQRTAIVKALLRHIAQIPVMLAVAEIFATDDSPQLDPMAVSAALWLVGRREENGAFPAEEREPILKALAKICTRKRLDEVAPKSAGLRMTILSLLVDGARDSVPGVHEDLVRMRDRADLPAALREEIGKRLAGYRGMVACP